MKEFGTFILIVAFLGAVFFGYIHFIQKSMGRNKPATDTSELFRLEADHKIEIEDVEKKKRLLMEERKRKLEDHRRKF